MKAIILDIDGVLNNMVGPHTKSRNGYLGMQPELVERLMNVINSTGACVVLCSTWRLHDHWMQEVIDVLNIGERFVGRTKEWNWFKNCPFDDERQWEVETWIDENPNYTKCVCIDDSAYPVARANCLKITCNNNVGFTDENAKTAIDFLNA